MTPDAPNLYIVNFLGFQERKVGVVVSDPPEELDIGEELPTVALSEFQIPDHEIVIVDILHSDGGRRAIECALILIRIEYFKSQIDSLSIENLFIDATRTVFGHDSLLTQVHSPDDHCLPIDQLV